MYIDLVYCIYCGQKYLFRAPFCTGLREGDSVMIETNLGIRQATVKASASTRDNGELYEFILKMAGATHPLKRAISVMNERELDYNGEIEEEKGNDE